MLKYRKIAQELRDKIINGDYIPNEKLPNEKEMCEKYMASRITVKKPWIYWFRRANNQKKRLWNICKGYER